jgi:hypothetical protein
MQSGGDAARSELLRGAGMLELVAAIELDHEIEEVVEHINRANEEYRLGLSEHRARQKAAVWSIGNCLLSAYERDHLTEVSLFTVRVVPPDDPARDCWNRLGALWHELKWLAKFEPLQAATDNSAPNARRSSGQSDENT